MVLEVRGIEKSTQKFAWLWGKHVTGFNQAKHCLACLKGPDPEEAIDPQMVSCDYPLKATGAPYFYLCGVGRTEPGRTNVHLVVEPCPGAVASVGSVYGITFTIRDARALQIDRLPKGWMGLTDRYTTCRNFQFGVQVFGYKAGDPKTAPGDHSLLPEMPISNF